MTKQKKTGVKKKKQGPTKAERADIHELYEKSVQCVESEIDFVDDTYKKIRRRRAVRLREDFSGTMNTSCEWVRRRRTNLAWCVDIDEQVLAWGQDHNLAALTRGQRQRVNVVQGDVKAVKTPKVDVALAMNFSYWIFKTRQAMTGYFRRVHDSLDDGGIFFLDSFGGSEAFKEMTESTDYGKFTYVWDQHKYNPITGEALFYIHFRFKDGSKIRKAFTYDWRIWTLPEITEMLTEAGFAPSVYWEGTGEDGEGNGEFSRTTEGEADRSWIAYIVAEK